MTTKSKFIAFCGGVGVFVLALLLMSGDHNDGPSVAGTTYDIADFFAFRAPDNADNMVLVVNVQGLLAPGRPTEEAAFDEDVLTEINIDLNNDQIEDVRIQAIRHADTMYFFGPFHTSTSGTSSVVNTEAAYQNKVIISTVEDIFIENNDGMKFFAGPRDDAFFFDRARFDAYMAGSAATGFNNPGTDNYAGKNVLSIVMEIPKSMLGNPVSGVNPWSPNTPTYGMWVTTSRRNQ